MSKGVLYGIGYQVINFSLLLVQAIFLPRYLGLELYGVGLLLILPVLLFGGFWEPIVQRYCISGDGIPNEWWLSGGLFVLLLYILYLFALLPSNDGGVVVFFLKLFFLVEYILAVYLVAGFQARKEYAKIFFLSLCGFVLCGIVFLLERSSWLVCVFYSIYFLPVFICGALTFKGDSKAVASIGGAFGDVLDAISTRLFYVLVNNFYVILVGFVYGPSKAAILKIVISLSSAFRFCNPLSIGHFYSMVHDASWEKKLKFSTLPLVFFFVGVLLVWFLLPWVGDYGVLFLGNSYHAVHDFFFDILWGIPFYLWSPYLTIVFFRVIGWRYVFLICSFSLISSSLFLYFDSISLFFVFSCLMYCLFILFFGGWLEIKRSRVRG